MPKNDIYVKITLFCKCLQHVHTRDFHENPVKFLAEFLGLAKILHFGHF